MAAYNKSTEGFTTNALFLSGVYPMGAHSVAATLGAMKGEWQGDMTGLDTDEADVLMGGVIYRYRLSKRTTLYTAASYTKAGDPSQQAAAPQPNLRHHGRFAQLLTGAPLLMPAYPAPRGIGRGRHFCGNRCAAPSGMIRTTDCPAEARFERPPPRTSSGSQRMKGLNLRAFRHSVKRASACLPRPV